MKIKKVHFAIFVALISITFAACEKDTITGEAGQEQNIDLQGLTLDPVCDYFQLPLAEADGNLIVNFCTNQQQQVPCLPGQPGWGNLTFYKLQGTYPNSSLRIEVGLAPGWLAQSYRFVLSNTGSIQTNGNLPIVTTDWITEIPPAYVNFFIIEQLLAPEHFGNSCFDWALEIDALKVSFFGSIFPGSPRTLRAYDVNGSGSPFVIDRCYASCDAPDVSYTEGTCQGCRAEVAVNFTGCTSATISSCKVLRQVVVVYEDCSKSYFDNPGVSSMSIPASGKRISHVFVRSGCRGNLGNPSQDMIDTNGNSFHNVLRRRFDAGCVNSNCN